MSKIKNNTFFCNNNLDVLRQMDSESVDMIYMDPPFNAKRTFTGGIKGKQRDELKAYFDLKNWEWNQSYEEPSFSDVWTRADVNPHEQYQLELQNPNVVEYLSMIEATLPESYFSYLTFMAVRLIECKRVLKSTGTIWYHCDNSMSHYIKVLLDLIFGENNFINHLTWCYDTSGRGKYTFQKKYDSIFFYSKTNDYIFNQPRIKAKPENISRYNKIDEDGNRYFMRSGKYKVIYNDTKPMPDWWIDIEPLRNNSTERVGYPTQKPLALLHRIIKASTNEGDIVLDPFCGCATTCVAAEQLNRKWIGIDINDISIKLVEYRMDKEVHGWNSGEVGALSFNFENKSPIDSLKVDPIKEQDQESHIYICQEERNGVLYTEKKIGKADDLESRLKSLNGTLSPTKYKFTAAWKVKDGLSVEKRLHEVFKSQRSVGEWFLDENNDLIDSIESIMKLVNAEKII